MIRVLVIDDDVNVLAAFAAIVSSHRYTVITTNDVDEAMRVQEKFPVDLVITDPQMALLDGTGIILAMRASDAELKVVAISGTSNRHSTLTLAQGADATFTQPLQWDGILKTIDSLTTRSG